MQQPEQDDMASNNHDDRRAASGSDPSKRTDTPSRPVPPTKPPILNSGLEMPRSNDC
jgi:hypothetical protein